MKKLVKIAALLLSAAILAGCGNAAQPVQTTESAHAIVADIEVKEITTIAQTDAAVESTPAEEISADEESDEDEKLDFVGWKLNEAVDALKKIGLDKSYIDWESDSDETIIAKSNWTITEQYISDNKLCFTCTHTSKGIINPIRATGKKALKFLSDAESTEKLKNVLENISTVSEIKNVLEDIFVSDK